ncbi:MAG: NADH-quinone oxidoreductase subunit J [Deltaproteobacteria bacterium]|nr:NADH-quinone oxidoreductase subunit J [Deltaproteobacteria bacterium]
METFIVSVIFIVTVGSACIVAFSNNLVYSAFALIGTFLGVAGTFIYLNATFLGLVQLVVYAGGILVLIIFAVMLTSKINESSRSNPGANYKAVVPLVLLLVLLVGRILTRDVWTKDLSGMAHEPTITALGNLLLTDYLLPFELVSVVLLAAMIGAAVISRRKVKTQE